MIEINHGVRVNGTEFWLDATKTKELSFVSHAHTDHAVRHRVAIVSQRTAILYQHRVGQTQLIELPFNKPAHVGNARVTLFPSGHILGSSQILIETDKRVVYTGDIKVNKGETSEQIEIKPCDILIMECTYGEPRYVFPERERTVKQLVNFVEKAFDMRCTPVIFAYSLGKAQETIKILGDKGYRLRVHKRIYEIAKVYEQLGVRLRNYTPFPPFTPLRDVLLLPPYAKNFRDIKPIKKRMAILTGWALDKDATSRFGVDEVIPLSDHADYKELIRYVVEAQPKKVYTLHGSPKFASILMNMGIHAVHLFPLPT